MNIKEIKDLINFLIEKDIAEFGAERGNGRVRIRRDVHSSFSSSRCRGPAGSAVQSTDREWPRLRATICGGRPQSRLKPPPPLRKNSPLSSSRPSSERSTNHLARLSSFRKKQVMRWR